jgi:hypothetical protein
MMHRIVFQNGSIVEELNEILKPSWGAEKWIYEGWERISTEDKELIKGRIDDLFKDGLPFELKYDKLLYIYTFSLLAQLEVLAIQVPLKFKDKLSSSVYKERMHVQLLDEIFHGLVFTKIVYMLCAPHALPPAYNGNVELLCDFIRNEDCPKVGVVLLNLISEGWIEEIFYSLKKQNIAPEVFRVIIDDEHRHVCEAELYSDIGLPNMEEVRSKLEYLEEQLLTNIFLQYKYVLSICSLLGVNGSMDFVQSLNSKHTEQLSKINLVPSEKWKFFMGLAEEIFPKVQEYNQVTYEVEMSPIRKVFMTQWSNPSDPTMAGEFNINVTPLDFFGKKYPPETITTLMMQTISQGLASQDSFRNYLSHKKLYQSKEAYVAIVVKLPDCGDHVGNIIFENCHQLSVKALSIRIRQILHMMVYCFKKREQLEEEHPELKRIFDADAYDYAYGLYEYPLLANPFTTLSNIGFCGYTQAKSPLRRNEGLKFTLFEIDRKPVWNKETQSFEPQDILPVSVSADHRIFDGNIPIPKLMIKYFHENFQRMINDTEPPVIKPFQDADIVKTIEELLANNLELGYKALLGLQTVWVDFMKFDEVFNKSIANRLAQAKEMFEKSGASIA